MTDEAAQISQTVGDYGTDTLVNQRSGLKAIWSSADAGRSQMFLDEADWHKPSYDVTLPTGALSAPYNVGLGSELLNMRYGWKCVVARIDTPDGSNGLCNVHILAVTVGR